MEDDFNFEQHWSVEYWRDYTSDYYSDFGPSSQLPEAEHFRTFLQRMSQAITDQASGARTAIDVAYWAYHLLRVSAFALSNAGSMLGMAAVTGSVEHDELQAVNQMALTDGRKILMVCLLSRSIASHMVAAHRCLRVRASVGSMVLAHA
jgi:hypothetical protein